MSKERVMINNLKLFLALFAFWVLLSEKFEVKFLLMGLGASLIGTFISREIMILSRKGNGEVIHGFDFSIFKYIKYWIWLIGQIIIANVQIAFVILNPKLPINPRIVVFKQKMANPLAHLSLGNSITLTPGTVTVDIDDGDYIIHALTDDAAAALYFANNQGDIRKKVADLFDEKIEKDDL
jgi:multicomponent Na+:H+ antiporter subunit E